MQQDIGNIAIGGLLAFWVAAALLATARENGGWPFSLRRSDHPYAIFAKGMQQSDATGQRSDTARQQSSTASTSAKQASAARDELKL